MRVRSIAVMVGVLGLPGLAAPMPARAQTGAPTATARPTDLDAIRAATRAWVDALNSRDPKRITALYAPDAVFWGTTARAIATDPAGLWAYFKDSGERPAVRVRIDSEAPRVYGALAINSGAYTFMDVRDGVTSNVRPSRFTFVFRREGDRWLIVDHHSSRVPEP